MQIILTGISQGLGKALFDILAEQNVKLTAFSRRFLDDQITLASQNKNIELFKIDLTDTNSIEKILENITFDKNCIFINNAARINPIDSIQNLTLKDINEVIKLNFITPILFLKKLINKNLTVINLATGASKHPIDKWSLYCSTKAAFEMFLKVAQAETHTHIYNYDPGVMDTSMQEIIRNSHFNNVDSFINFKKQHKLKSPHDVAFHIYNEFIKGLING